ncbi:RimJ/RimL family protein N-acetyltransferase [Algoriphagus iocasae]|uniref:RimJ/RimL family protein N-acetyltransferase n=1 Tax=Algoriphagus iocasae TaxID=1836499 RepID=A0A841MZA0_9BACT|nr:GNAT family protein [Algoriphagus iocasae]MBB6327968.1 RimJ/RimL family protein N-acetyltransferase [Algoriphagus iocasae]
MIQKVLILENEKVLLRPISEQDFSSLKPLCNDPDMWTWFTFDLSTEEGFSDWVIPALAHQRIQFTVVDKTSGKVAGSTAFGSFSPRDQRLEIGWTWLGKEFQGTGINQEMKYLMLEHCFESLKLMRVEIKTDVLNLPARKALLKLGAVEEGVLRSHTLMVKGRRRDTIYYSVLPEEWEKIKEKKSGN